MKEGKVIKAIAFSTRETLTNSGHVFRQYLEIRSYNPAIGG
jgi:hypothetical protein